MEKDTSNHHRGQSTTNTQNRRRHATGGEIREDQTTAGEPDEWKALESNFRQVQSVLDRNKALIEQVNANHQSRTHRNLVENVSLIQEINGNISKVVSLYSGFSADLTQVFRLQEAAGGDDQNGTEKAQD